MSRPEHRDANSQGIPYTGGMDSRAEFGEPLQTNIYLTRSQQEARQRVVEILEGGVPRIVLVGFSGVGKNVVLRSLEPELTRTSAQIFDPDQLWSGKPNPKRSAITTSTPSNFESIVNELSFGQQAQNVIVAGMDDEEIKNFVDGLEKNGELAREEVIRYSMGIPGLAVQLAQPYMTKDVAESLAAQYLNRNLFDLGKWGQDIDTAGIQAGAEKYLRVALPWGLTVTSQRAREVVNFRGESVYGRLSFVIDKLDNIRRRGIRVESPLFVAPESQEIYDRTAENNTAWLDIFVPEITQEDLAYIERQMFNMTGRRGIDSGPVARAFVAGRELSGKFGVYFKNLAGRNVGFSSESFGNRFNQADDFEFADRIVEKLLKVYRERAFKATGVSRLEPSDRANLGSLLVHKHGHGGYQAGSIIMPIGWMMESFLQQRGIGYVAVNLSYKENYLYDPKTNHIESFGKFSMGIPASRALDELADVLSSKGETEAVGFPENIRQADFYTRLKEKFGKINTEEGLQSNSLSLGDVYDVATLYNALLNENPHIKGLDPHMAQTVATAAIQALDAAPDEIRDNFNTQADLLRRRHNINSMDRSDPIFELPVDLRKLIQDSFLSYYEISHYPGGIIIRSKHEDRNHYEVLLTQRNATDDPIVYEVFKETGLPVLSN